MIPPFTLRNREEIEGAIFISFVAALILGSVLWTIFYELRVRSWLATFDERHLPAKATVTSVVPLSDSHAISVRYRFIDANGRTREGSQRFPQLLAAKEKLAFAPQDAITVMYNPDSPNLSYIDGQRAHYQRSETHYIENFIAMGIFMTSFFYTSSLIWPFVLTLAFPLLLGGIRIALRAKTSNAHNN